ncbi:DUF4157 domain-containing protein [Micromonospora sp. NPDC093277]|uniref:eCIS core domain-containing protein n=1 Tax=Micromonospora sp. NPDC093277 TaxID=3364291 RepID=UPI0037F16CF1
MPRLDAPAPPIGSSGEPLDAGTRALMEPRLGWDLAQVRVHTGRNAADSATALGAQAYTVGRHIVLGAGAGPGSDTGRRLLAHELAHVAQQARGESRGALHLKPGAPPAPAGSRKPRPFRLLVTRVMSPPELLREFVRQYYQTASEQEVDRRLPLWHWQNPGGRGTSAADVRRGFIMLPVTDATQAAMRGLSEAEQHQINAAADARFWQENGLEPGTKLGTGPKDAALRGRWRGARADVLREHAELREIEALPDDVKRILFGGDRTLAPEEYEKALWLAHKLSGLTKAQRTDYLSKVNAGTTSWAELDASIERYLLDQRIREAETVRTEAAAATLFGCEDLYRAWQRRNLVRAWTRSVVGPAHDPVLLREMGEATTQFRAALSRHGFADEAAFRAAMDAYLLRFRSEAVTFGLDVLARYDHLLYEERRKLQDLGYLQAMVAGIAKTTARADYAAAAEKASFARLTVMGVDPESPVERWRAAAQAAKYSAEASALRTAASTAVVTASGGDPLVDPEKLGRGTDRERLAGADATTAQRYLLDVVRERLSDTAKARYEFTNDPERIFSLPDLVAATMKSQGAEADTIYAWIVRDHIDDIRSAHLFSAIVLGIIALVLAVLVPGGGWLAAAALVANTGISAYQAIEAIKEYQQQAVEYRLSFIQDEPSLFWVGVAVAAAALDLGMTAAQLLKMSAKGLSSLEGPLREFAAASDVETAALRFEKLTAKIDAAEGLQVEVKAALKARAAAELGLKRALSQMGGRLMGSAGVVDPVPLFEGLYYGIKKGVNSITKLRKDAQLLELMGDVTKMSGAGRAEITTAFEQVKQVVTLGEKRGMDEAAVLRYVDRLAAERSAGEGAFQALLEEMRAWRRPTQEQVQAEAKLAAASDRLASLRQYRAELEAELRARPKTPAGTPDTERIAEIRKELDDLDGVVRADRSGIRRVDREGLITQAERSLREAETLAESARLDPTTRMRQVFGASRERADVVATATVDQVGQLRTPSQGLAVDHVVSLKRMSQMEGFDKLKAIERNALAVRRDNLVLMDASANASKGERSWTAWQQASTFYAPDVVASWAARDAELTKTIQEWILATIRGR